MADIFDVIADATRRDLLQVLLDRAMMPEVGRRAISVGEMVDRLGLSQPTVSKHLKVLRDIGLVSVREEGQHRYYSLNVDPLDELETWLIPFLSVDFDTAESEVGMTVFNAWAGESLRAPFRRVAGILKDPSEAGTAIGRALADGVHPAKRVGEALRRVKSGWRFSE